MKFSAAVLAVAMASVASAQLDNVPNCALNCFVTALTSDGCSSLTDFKCHCSKPELIPTVQPCVEKACSPADVLKVADAVEGTCKQAGVPITVPRPGASSSAPASSAPASSSPASSAPASSAPVSSAPASSTGAVSSSPAYGSTPVASTVSSVVSSTPVVTPSSNGTTPIATPTPSQFTGAAALPTQAAGLFGAAALALVAAL